MAPVTFPADYRSFKNAVIGQDSGGRYGVANTQGSGAMGVGQIMPATAQALSQRLGLPYRPDLLSSSTPQAKSYQDALTEAAVREAWNYGNGNPSIAASYYFAGPDRGKWGPQTQQYVQGILSRLGQ